MMNRQFPACSDRLFGRGRGFVAVLVMSLLCFAAKAGASDMAGTMAAQSNAGIQKTSSSDGANPPDGVSFPTFYRTGLKACPNDDGKPVILLFSSSSCSHCEWVGEAFDFIARYYMASGLIEAHHYDVNTGDDRLTEETETKIPSKYLQSKEHGDPEGYVPYFNFGCEYERIGNGYEKTKDLAAEAAEMRKVIDTLIRMSSKGG